MPTTVPTLSFSSAGTRCRSAANRQRHKTTFIVVSSFLSLFLSNSTQTPQREKWVLQCSPSTFVAAVSFYREPNFPGAWSDPIGPKLRLTPPTMCSGAKLLAGACGVVESDWSVSDGHFFINDDPVPVSLARWVDRSNRPRG